MVSGLKSTSLWADNGNGKAPSTFTSLGNLTTQFYLDAWPTDDLEDRPSEIKVR